MKAFFQGLLAAVIGGAVTGAAGQLASGGSWKVAGQSAAAGAVVTVAGLFAKSPTDKSAETPKP